MPSRLCSRWLLAPLLLLGAMLVSSLATSAGDSNRAVLLRLVAEADALPLRAVRERVAWGEVRSGVAFAHYAEANRLIEPLQGVMHTLGRLRLSPARILHDREAAKARPVWQLALPSLEAGAHAQDLLVPRGSKPNSSYALACAVRLECAMRLAERRPSAAVHLWLDGVVALLDTMRTQHVFACWGMWPRLEVTIRCWSDEWLEALDELALRALAEGLAPIGRELDVVRDARFDLAICARHWLGMELATPRKDWNWSDRMGAWRHGFDPASRYRGHLALAFSNLGLIELPQRGLMARAEQFDRFQEACGVSQWDREDMVSEMLEQHEWSRREALTWVRLLQCDIDLRLGGPVQPRFDPFGEGPIVVERGADCMEVRSAARIDGGCRRVTIGK